MVIDILLSDAANVATGFGRWSGGEESACTGGYQGGCGPAGEESRFGPS
jgi:hypothetical protein